MTIDIEELREDMLQECYGAAFVGRFGGAFLEASDIENASPDELARIAQQQGIDLRRYAVD